MSHSVGFFWVFASCGVILMAGCKDKNNSSPSSSQPAKSVQVASPVSSDQPVTGIPVNQPGMFRDVSMTVSQIVQTVPMEAPVGQERARVVVTPGAPATVEAGVVRVDVPAGLVEADAVLVVSPVQGVPKFPAPDVKLLKAWDLKMEGHTVLSQPVEMSVPLEYDKLGKSAPGYSDSYSHEYGASRFIQYVVETRRLMSFGEFVRETLDTPASLLTMEEMSAGTFGAATILGAKIEAFDTYTVSVTFDKIYQALLKHKAYLPEVWQGLLWDSRF